MTHDEWRLRVRQTIGGSSAGAALGKGRFKSRRELWAQMVAARDGILPPERETDDMRRGRMLEGIARQAVEERIDVPIRPHNQTEFVTNPDYPFAHCLPDGWLPDGGLVEIKVPRPATVAKVAMHGLFDEWRMQAEHNATIARAPYTLVGIMDPLSTRVEIVTVKPDPEFVAMMMRAEEEFFALVEARTPPEADPAPQPDAREEPGSVARLDTDEAIRAAENYVRLRSLIEEVDEVLDEAKQRLAVLSGCTVLADGKLAGGPEAFEVPGLLRVYHRATAGRKTFDKDRAIARHPELAGAEFWKIGAGSRAWRPYILRRGE